MAGNHEIPQFKLETGAGKPKTAPERNPAAATEKSAEAIPSIGETMAREFKTDAEKGILGAEFQKTLHEQFSQFTKEFQTQFCDAKGQPNIRRILGLFGLDKFLGPYIPGEVTTTETASKSPTNTPKAASAGTETPSLSDKLPENLGTMTGTQFMNRLKQLGNLTTKKNQHIMEMMIEDQISKKNMPSFCLPENGKTIAMKGADGTLITTKSSRDYFAIGTDKDFARIPMSPTFAQAMAKKYGWGLPTGPLTDAFHDTAEIKLQGIGLVNTAKDEKLMRGAGFIEKHDSLINHQLNLALDPEHTQKDSKAKPNEKLTPAAIAKLQSGKYSIAGSKKDNIISADVVGNPEGEMAFRGLYIDGGNPIQTNSAHTWDYFDYASGVRFNNGTVLITYPKGHPKYPNGHTETKSYYAALADPQLGDILNRGNGKGNGQGTGAFNAEMAYVDPRKKSTNQLPGKVA